MSLSSRNVCAVYQKYLKYPDEYKRLNEPWPCPSLKERRRRYQISRLYRRDKHYLVPRMYFLKITIVYNHSKYSHIGSRKNIDLLIQNSKSFFRVNNSKSSLQKIKHVLTNSFQCPFPFWIHNLNPYNFGNQLEIKSSSGPTGRLPSRVIIVLT